ncbi:MAG: sugar transferase [Rhodobacteraceae bacterium]|nr:sugar transferase [Paracoccaceae bacterium]
MAAPQFEFSSDLVPAPSSGFYRQSGKRLTDLVLVAVMLPVVAPVMLLIVAMVSLGGGSPFYSQLRVGKNGQYFRCWKIRTMIPDAEAALPRILSTNPALREEWHRTQKLARDPRVTVIGRLLRRLSLDELPQLFNVVNGTMSLVGPRPFMPAQAGLYRNGRRDTSYYRLQPGITGLWQVGRRNEGSFEERAHYDAKYEETIGLVTDMRILVKTVGVVFRATGR